VRKRQRRFEGFDEKIIALYARGMSVRDIQAHLQEIYSVHVGHDLVSRVPDAVMNDVRAWQQRPLEDVYPIVFLDCLVIKVRDGGSVQRRACYRALVGHTRGRPRRARDVVEEHEGAKFWLQVLSDLKQRGVQDILIACVDGLKGFPDAIEAVFPKTWVQTCIVHLIRHSLRFVPRHEREQVARDLKPIYTALEADAAWAELERFDEQWGERTLASAGDKTIRLWDVHAPKQVGVPLTRRAGFHTSIAFSPDGQTLASGSLDQPIRLWDLRTRKQLGTPLRAPHVVSMAFSPNGRTLATTNTDETIRFWDVRTRKQLGAPPTGHTDSVVSGAFSPDSRTLATINSDGDPQLWDVRTRKQLGAPLTGHTGAVETVAFSPDGRTLASGGQEVYELRLWDMRTHKQLGAPLTGHNGTISTVAFTNRRTPRLRGVGRRDPAVGCAHSQAARTHAAHQLSSWPGGQSRRADPGDRRRGPHDPLVGQNPLAQLRRVADPGLQPHE
jgi:hypothetical protein